jgi:hypothetical protein
MIGWYVHHHGHGHLTRFLAVRPHLPGAVVVFSSLRPPAELPPETSWTVLPFDADIVAGDGGTPEDPRDADPTARGLLHWAPLDHPGHRERLAAVAAWIASARPDAFVVDVSAEVAVLVRLLGTRTVVVTQPGDRTDPAHRLAYALAERILAPWASGTADAAADRVAPGRVVHVGGISRHDARAAERERDPRSVLILGRVLPEPVLDEGIEMLRAAGWRVRTAGAREADPRVADVWPLLCRSTVVVAAAGQNSVADLAAAGSRAVVIAQERPFAEQVHTAQVLADLGLAVVAPAEPAPAELVALVARAARLEPDWSSWQVAGAAARAAAVIGAVARATDAEAA